MQQQRDLVILERFEHPLLPRLPAQLSQAGGTTATIRAHHQGRKLTEEVLVVLFGDGPRGRILDASGGMQRLADDRDGLFPRNVVPGLAEKVRVFHHLSRRRLLQPAQQCDVPSGQIQHVYGRPYGRPPANLSGIAVFESKAGQRGQLDRQTSVLVLDPVDQRRDHDCYLGSMAELLARPDNGQVNCPVWRRVGQGVDVLWLVVRVDSVGFVLALCSVAEEAGAAGVNVDGLLAVLCPPLDALEDGLDGREVVGRSDVQDNVAGNGLFGDDFTVGQRAEDGLDTVVLQLGGCRFSSDECRDRVAFCQKKIDDIATYAVG